MGRVIISVVLAAILMWAFMAFYHYDITWAASMGEWSMTARGILVVCFMLEVAACDLAISLWRL